MKEIKWTTEQLSAIEEKGTDLLVSAAAGSGKTAVLTERIIRELTDASNPVDITDFLIVTFTVAATTELREKLSSAVRRAYNENRANKRLKRQIVNLPFAKIQTIDSFCKFVVNECAKDLNIPSDFETSDESELLALSESVLSTLLDECFEGRINEPLYDTSYLPNSVDRGFLSIVKTFPVDKGFDPITKVITETHKKMLKFPEPMAYMRESLYVYDDMLRSHYKDKKDISFFDTTPAQYVVSEIRESIAVSIKYFEEAREILSSHEEMSKTYLDSISDDLAQVTRLSQTKSINELLKALSTVSFLKLKPYRPKGPEDSEAQESFKLMRDEGKSIIKSIQKKFPVYDEEKLYWQCAQTFSVANELFSLIAEYDRRLFKAKVDKKMFSFSDVAHLAYKALIKDGTYDRKTRSFEKTDYANELSEKFHEILIDEYQDVNELQDSIFRALSNSHNRFMVGDLKQSIYKFRGATPEIFSEYRNTFKPIDSDGDDARLIALQNNFRSDSNVIDFVNSLFDVVMNYRCEDVYRKEDFLRFSKPDDSKLPVEISVFEDGSEMEYIADRIIEEVQNGNASFGDICIIARGHSSLREITQVLSQRGVPTDYTPNADFFNSWEIHTVHSILKAIDNPIDDVALLSAMTSPFFSFSPAELLEIRKDAKKQDVYFSVKDYSENGDVTELKEKCKNAVMKLKLWRNKSRTASSDSFIWWLYRQINVKALLKRMNDADTRIDNILSYYDMAVKFEKNEFRGVSSFISYIDAFAKSKGKTESKIPDTNSVHIMTSHLSKGLEFPICFYADAGHSLNREDERDRMIISDTFGPAFCVPTGNIGGRVSTYLQKAAISQIRCESVDEELRVLYVALTRAKSKLIITGTEKLSNLKKQIILGALNRTSFTHCVKSSTNILRTIALGMYNNEVFSKAINSYNGENLSLKTKQLEINLFSEYETKELKNEPVDNGVISDLPVISADDIALSMMPTGNRLLTQTPYKISVSSIREGLLDEGATVSQSRPKKYPKFMSLSTENIASFTGTAMHVFMQFCDFENCVKNGTPAEAERLLKYEFITEEQMNVLNHRSLNAFFSSKTYKAICNAKRVEREKRYTLLLPSSSFYTDSDTKEKLDLLNKKTLIQGVIDCYFENEDGTITLLDFKTDNVNAKDGESVLRERHKRQMLLYKKAIEETEGLAVSKIMIYSFCLSKEILIDND